jgi:hypothetical protein
MQFSTVYPIEVSVSGNKIMVEGCPWQGSFADLSSLLTGLNSVDGVFAEGTTEFVISPRRKFKVKFDKALPDIAEADYLQVLKDRVDSVWYKYEIESPAVC